MLDGILNDLSGSNRTTNSIRATWVKFGIAVLCMAGALVIFKIVFTNMGALFLTAFGSFATVFVLSVALYQGVLFFLARRATRSQSSGI